MILPCPLCANPAHEGKCPKEPKGLHWCALCLLAHVTPAPPAVPRVYLLGAGVKRTEKWCTRCGAPLCAAHTRGSKAGIHCELDCRQRAPSAVQRLKAVIALYNPDFAPPLCAACETPAVRQNLCRYHYVRARAGYTELEPERQRPSRKGRSRLIQTYVRPEWFPYVRELADFDAKSMSAWVADLIEAELEKRVGNLRSRFIVCPDPTNK